jgi:hypothetical protein
MSSFIRPDIMPSDKDNKVRLIVSAELSVGITIDRSAGIYIGNPE